ARVGLEPQLAVAVDGLGPQTAQTRSEGRDASLVVGSDRSGGPDVGRGARRQGERTDGGERGGRDGPPERARVPGRKPLHGAPIMPPPATGRRRALSASNVCSARPLPSTACPGAARRSSPSAASVSPTRRRRR